MAGVHVHAIKLTLHSWELPSWPREHLRSATAGALRAALAYYYPEARAEIAFNAGPDETVLEQHTGRETAKGAKLELDIRGGTEHERHMNQHLAANTVEGIMRKTLQIFIEHDAVSRFRQMQAGYKTFSDVDEPAAPKGRILT
jgi:hypothetical protein